MSFTSWLRNLRSAVAPGPARGTHRRQRSLRATTHRLGLEVLEDRSLPSTFTVLNLLDSGAGSLRQAVLDANANPGADTIDFSTTGSIGLTTGQLDITDSLTINGPGASALTVSGNHASRVFDISAGVTVSIAGMTMTDGLADGSSPVLASTGGGILNRGNLTLTGDVLSNNQAVGDAGTSPLGRVGGAVGGGLANLGTLIVSSSAFTGNQALGADHSSGNSAGNALGGAILTTGVASITDSQFTFNATQAGSNCSGNIDASGTGGAIQNSGSLTVTGSTFSHNKAVGGNDSSGPVRPGLGSGGAILSGGSAGTGTTRLVVSASTFDHNQAIGGNNNRVSPATSDVLSGPNEAFGGAIHLSGGSSTISGCTIAHNSVIGGVGGAGQDGGLAWGGGLDTFNAFGNGLTATVSNCTIGHNSVTGGAGGPGGSGGDGWGGGVANLLGSVLTVVSSTVDHNLAFGGAGGSGGNGADGEGGGIFQDELSTLTLQSATVGHNLAIGGAAGIGGSDGEGEGGGLYLEPGGVACADLLTAITKNHASTSDDDVSGTLGSC
jgi:hypothetical protein